VPDSRQGRQRRGAEGTGNGKSASLTTEKRRKRNTFLWETCKESAWNGVCSWISIVKSLRTAVSALAVIVALISVTIAPVSAGPAGDACTPTSTVKAAHDCCKTPVLKACCSERSDWPNQGAPAQSRVQLNPNIIAAPAIFVVDLSSGVRTIAAEQAAPRAGPTDLPTFLSTLLI
jgi:hypothetical protein